MLDEWEIRKFMVAGRVCVAAVSLVAFVCAFSGYLYGADDGVANINLHISFDDENYVAHAKGAPFALCLKPNLIDGMSGKAVYVTKKEESLRLEALHNLDRAKGSLSMWYCPRPVGAKKQDRQLFWSGNSFKKGDNGMSLWIWGKSLRFDVRDPKDSFCLTSCGDWKGGEWVHIVATWDCKKGLSLWVNGVKKAQKEATWTPNNKVKLMSFGVGSKEKQTAAGAIDEIKIFDRVLSEAEVLGEFSGSMSFAYSDIAVTPGVAQKHREPKREPLKTMFYIDFEKEFSASSSVGDLLPINKNLPALVEGKKGKGVTLKWRQALTFPAKKVLRKERGALAMWVKTPDDLPMVARTMDLFREDASNKIGENCLWFWVFANRGLRIDPRDKKDTYTLVTESWKWKKSEWHHFIVTWDCKVGMRVFIDGKLCLRGIGRDSSKSFIPVEWEPKEHDAFCIGSHNSKGEKPWLGVIDEVKLFNRPLTLEEAQEEYLRIAESPVLVKSIDPYPYAGEDDEVSVSLENISDAPATVTVSYETFSGEDKLLASGEVGEVRVGAKSKEKLSVSVNLPEPGCHSLVVKVVDNGKTSIKRLDVIAVARTEKPAADVEQKSTLVEAIDAAALDYAIESAPSSIVDSPLGKYREAGNKRHDRFVVKFTVKEPHKPHVAVIEYPDDKPRTMEVLLQPLETRNDYQAQTGVFTGDEYTLSNKMLEHRIVFWPQCEKMSFIFMTVENNHPAAVKSLKIYKLDGGLKRLDVLPFVGSVPARSIGLYHEDPVLNVCYGKKEKPNESMRVFPRFETVIDRMLDYHQSFGMDTVHYPIAWYHGPLYGSDAEPSVLNTRYHPAGFPKYLMRRLNARGMKFNGWFHMHQVDSVYPYVILDEERVYAGEETPINMRYDNHLYYRAWHGKDPVVNPIDPHVQESVKAIVREVAERYGDEPAFTGITLNTVRHSIFAFGSLESGYNDINLKRFQEETGIKIPVDSKDRYRFARSWRWLMDNSKKEWIDWRCRKLRQYYKELAKILTDKRSDLKLGIVVVSSEVEYKSESNYIEDKSAATSRMRGAGIDPALYVNDKDIVLRSVMFPADLRWGEGTGVRSLMCMIAGP